MTDLSAARPDRPDSVPPEEAEASAPGLGLGAAERAASPNGSAHAGDDLSRGANRAADTPPPQSGEAAQGNGPAQPAPPPRQRRARRSAEPPDETQPHTNGTAGAAQIAGQPSAEPPPRRPRRSRKQSADVPAAPPAIDGAGAASETTAAPTPQVPVADSGVPSPESTAEAASTVSEGPATSSFPLDVPYTPPEAYQPAPDPFANLGPIGGTVATAEAPAVSAEPAPITVDMTPPPAPPAPPVGAEAGEQPAPPPSGDDEFDDGGGAMTIIEHLEELRRRLMWCLGAIAAGSFIGWFLAPSLVDLAKQPLIGKADVITLTVFGAFVLQIKMALAVGVCLSMPMTLYQIWAFVAPGLTRREKRYARPFVLLGTFLFAFGAAVGYFVFPKGVAFALTFNGSLGLKPTIEANGYVSFIALIMVLFGIAFELPVFMVFLSLIGLFSSQAMLARWRLAIVIIWAGSMVVTPGADIVSPVILAVILTLLYFLGIWLTKLVGR